MKQIILLKALLAACILSNVPVMAQEQTSDAESMIGKELKIEGTEREKIDQDILLKRYPVGKKWQAIQTFRIQGISTGKQRGLTGEHHIVYTNQYQSISEVLQNELGMIKFRIELGDISQTRVITEEKLKVADFQSPGPIFDFAVGQAMKLIKVHPILRTGIKLAQLYEKVDPGFERALTRIMKSRALEKAELFRHPDAMLLEDPEPLSGCAFEVVWTNGFGVTSCKQVTGLVEVKLTKSNEDQIRSWALTADPLFDYYIMDTLNREEGESWLVGAENAAQVLASQGAANGDGGLNLTYQKDVTYDNRRCRDLVIRSGELDVLLDREDLSTEVEVTEVKGNILYDKRAYLVLLAKGTCEIGEMTRSTDHWLFESKWTNDVDTEFRYEAKVLSEGNVDGE